jgi:hypothetical protein
VPPGVGAEAARKRAEERAAREEKKALDAWKQDQGETSKTLE